MCTTMRYHYRYLIILILAMKKEYILGAVGALIILGGVSAYAYTAGREGVYQHSMRGGMGQGERSFTQGGYREFDTPAIDGEFTHRLGIQTDTSALSDAETAGLLKMREEEKLARDVYQTLGEKWNVPVFRNIAVSEARHTESVKSLLGAHNVTDPVTDDARGVFQNQDLAKLYTELVDRGSVSVAEAYRVGAYIEDLDIADLEKTIAETTHDDIAFVYGNLKRGSQNHISAFNRNLEIATGESYTPSFISKDALELILDGNSTGFGGRGDGSGQGMRDGMGGGRGHGMGMGRP